MYDFIYPAKDQIQWNILNFSGKFVQKDKKYFDWQNESVDL